MANEFMEGAQGAMSIFQTSAMMANYQALNEDRVERRQLRLMELQRKETEDKQQEMQRDYNLSALASDPDKVPLDTALNHLNSMAAKYGNNVKVYRQDYDRFVGKVDSLFSRTDLPNAEQRREEVGKLADEASSHPAYLRGLSSKKARLEDWIARPAASAAFEATGFSPARTEHLLQNLRPGEAIGLLKDGDWRKAAIYTQASDAIRKVANGEEMADGELPQALTAVYGAGGKLGETGAEIVKGTTGESQYNLAQKDVDSLNKTVATPFAKLFGMIPQDKAIKSMVFTSAIEDPASSLGKHLKPEQNKQFQESIGKMEMVSEQAQKKLQDLTARYKIAKANPMTTPGDLILLDQQMDIERQKTSALMEPFKRYTAFKEEPTEANFQAITGAGKHLDETLRKWEGSKQKLLTVSEQKVQQEIETGKVTLATKQATNDAQEALLTAVSSAGLDRSQEKEIRALAAPIVSAMNAKHGAKLDVDELLKGYKASESTMTIKYPAEGERKDIAEAQNLLQSYNMMEALYEPGYVGMVQGKMGSVQEATGAITQKQADFYQVMDNVARNQRKLFGGVAVTPTELKLLLGTIPHRGMSDTQWESSVRMNKIMMGGDASAKVEVLKELGFKTPEKTAKAIQDAVNKAKTEVTQGAAKTPTSAGQWYDRIRKEHPKMSPAEIKAKAAAAMRGEPE